MPYIGPNTGAISWVGASIFVTSLIIAIVAIGLGTWYLLTPSKAQLPVSAVQGADPDLSKPTNEGFPSIRIADVVGWKDGEAPTPAKGLALTKFAAGLDHPRWLYELPMAMCWSPNRLSPSANRRAFRTGSRARIMSANNSDVPANRNHPAPRRRRRWRRRNKIRAGFRSQFAIRHGLGRRAVVHRQHRQRRRIPLQDRRYQDRCCPEETARSACGRPEQSLDAHLTASADGKTLYISIGSHGNIADEGIDKEKDRAQIKEHNLATGETNTFAYGLRNPNGLAFNPISGTLWATVNERDMLGPDGPPDYLTTVDFGTFYGLALLFLGPE